MTSRIVVFGATGYTGRLVVESLLAKGQRPLLAGRSHTGLQALADPHGLPFQTADVTDPDTVRALVDPGDVLVSTVGPFSRFGHAAAAAAAEVGAHYLDSTGEVDFVQEVRRRYSAQAAGNGATMVPAFGYDYVPGTLAGAVAAERAGTAAGRLSIGYFTVGSLRRGISGGTRATLAEGLALPAAVWRAGSLQYTRMASRTHAFRIHGRVRRAFLATGTEVLFLPEAFADLGAVEVYNGWFPALSRIAGPLTWVTQKLERVPAGKRMLAAAAKQAGGSGGGPDAQERSKSLSHAVAELDGQDGRPAVEVHVQGPNVYTLTGELLAEGAMALQQGKAVGSGVLGPVQAFGREGLTTLCASAGLTLASD